MIQAATPLQLCPLQLCSFCRLRLASIYMRNHHAPQIDIRKSLLKVVGAARLASSLALMPSPQSRSSSGHSQRRSLRARESEKTAPCQIAIRSERDACAQGKAIAWFVLVAIWRMDA